MAFSILNYFKNNIDKVPWVFFPINFSEKVFNLGVLDFIYVD